MPIESGKHLNFNDKVKSIDIIRQLLMLFRMFRHPIDTYDDIKRYNKSSYLAAFIIYTIFVIEMILLSYFEAFIFNNTNLEGFNVFREMIVLYGIIFLFVVSNYLISSLQNGEGFLKDVFISTSYALAPMIVFTPFIIIISHGLTLNELFIYQAINYISVIWVFLNIVIMIKEIHNYTITELIGNILLTIFTMIIIVVIIALMFLLANQLYEYIHGILKEVT